MNKDVTWSGNLTTSDGGRIRINGVCGGSAAGKWTGGIPGSWFPGASGFKLAVYGIINTSSAWVVDNNQSWTDTIYSTGSQTIGNLTVSGNGPGTIVNYGILVVNGTFTCSGNDFTIINKTGGTVTFAGDLNSGSSSFNVTNEAGATFNVLGGVSGNGANFVNSGRWNVTNDWNLSATTFTNNGYLNIGGDFKGNTNTTVGVGSYIKATNMLFGGNITGPASGCAALDFSSSTTFSGTVVAGNSARVFLCDRSNPGTLDVCGCTLNSANVTCASSGSPSCVALPIELLTFTAQSANHYNRLNWVTATETNNDYFTIEKSYDVVNWLPVTTVKGAGNSSSIVTYNSVDETPFKGATYYRLKQTDFDGKFSYSHIIVVNNNQAVSSIIYPNPSNGGPVNVSINGITDGKVLMVLYDSFGRTVYSKTMISTGLSGVLNTTIEPESNLAPGVYYIVATSKQELFRKVLVVSAQN